MAITVQTAILTVRLSDGNMEETRYQNIHIQTEPVQDFWITWEIRFRVSLKKPNLSDGYTLLTGNKKMNLYFSWQQKMLEL